MGIIDLNLNLNTNINNLLSFVKKTLSSIRSRQKTQTWEVKSFTATEQEESEQGCHGKRLDIPSDQRIRALSFTVESTDNFWRAGFKVFSPNGNFQPLADVKEGILFHLAYPHSQKNKIEALTLTSNGPIPRYIEKKKYYRIEMFVNKSNFMKCLANGEKCFEGRVNPNNLENAYLGAWADYKTDMGEFLGTLIQVKKFKVEFSDIRYTTTNF